MTTRGRQVVLAARPKGKPELTDFRLEETAIPTPADGQLLLGVEYLSLDPYMRGRMNDGKSYAEPLQIGEVMTGETVAHVLVSNHSAYVKGDVVLARAGWRTHALSDGAGLRKLGGFPAAENLVHQAAVIHRFHDHANARRQRQFIRHNPAARRGNIISP